MTTDDSRYPLTNVKVGGKVPPIRQPKNEAAAKLIYEDLMEYDKQDLVLVLADTFTQEEIDEFVLEQELLREDVDT